MFNDIHNNSDKKYWKPFKHLANNKETETNESMIHIMLLLKLYLSKNVKNWENIPAIFLNEKKRQDTNLYLLQNVYNHNY